MDLDNEADSDADELVLIGSAQYASQAFDPSKRGSTGSPAVRFASQDQQIEPKENLTTFDSGAEKHRLSAGTEAQLRELSSHLQGTNLHQHRFGAFEPVSLPVSRVRPFRCSEFSSFDAASISVKEPKSALAYRLQS